MFNKLSQKQPFLLTYLTEIQVVWILQCYYCRSELDACWILPSSIILEGV